MNLGEWCIKNNRTSAGFFLLVVFLGVAGYRSVPRLEAPEFIIRTALVITYLPGGTPQRVEELVTDKLESRIQEIPEVSEITSQSMSGVSIIEVEVSAKYTDMAPIWQRLRNKVDDVSGELPEGVQGPFVNDEFGDVFPVMIAITGDGYSYRELKDHADEVRTALLSLDQVAKVDIYGVQDERIYIEISNARMARTGISPGDLIGLLSSQNALRSSGSARVGAERILIEPTGPFNSVEEIRRFSIRLPGQDEAVRLDDIARVRRSYVDPPETPTRYNGERALILAVSMVADGKVTEMAPAVVAEVERMNSEMPWGIELACFFSQEKYVTRSINDFMLNLLQAFGFVVIVMLFFTGLRNGLVAGALVPMAMLMCLMLMPVFSISLQQVSIAALIIALGMLVDNGVVTSENILVRMTRGEERLAAVGGAVSELWLPLLTSSLTTICAFLPIALAQSMVAEYCFSLFQVVAITLLCSWLLSITLIPVLCFYFLKPKPARGAFDNLFYRAYRVLLIGALRHRFAFLAGVVLVFVAAIWGFRFVPSVFFPPNEREMLLVDFWQPYGTDITATSERLVELEHFLLGQTNEVESVASFIGTGGPRWYLSLDLKQDNPNYAHVIVTLRSFDQVPAMQERIRALLEERFPDGRYTVSQLENGPPVGAPIQVRISGAAMDEIYEARDLLRARMAGVDGLVNIRDDWGEWTKKLSVEVNQEKAKQAGFSSEDVALSLQSQMSGMPVTQYREGKNLIPVVLRSDSAYREDLGKIESMSIYSYAHGHNLPLMQLATTHLEWQPSDIRRRDRTRTMALEADVSGRFPSAVLADLVPEMDRVLASPDWPAGCSVAYGGEDADSDEAQQAILAVLPLALGLMIVILIAQFNSVRRPVIILLTIPPMLGGVVPGLILTNAPFGFMAFLGLISLMGVIVNNAIMMIDRIEIERAAGQAPLDALVVAAQRRLRPILATATTTVIGLVPLSLGGGELWRPMANTIMSGLAFATLLTLLLCPVLYSLLFNIRTVGYQWNASVLGLSDGEQIPSA